MQNLDSIAEELFNKVRGRFPSITIGDAEGNVTTEPKQARYFDFDFMNEGRPVGKVSISLDEKSVAVVYGEDLVATESDIAKKGWYDFLKELRMFARKRALTFDTRDITKSNLNSRDYKFLAKNRGGDENMNESKMYGTSRVSYQNFDGARLMIKHTEGIDQDAPGGRAKKVGALYIESAEGERFKYPYKHVTGARAMARHVAEGGNAYDDFGKHIVGMSEELSKLRKFKTYMGRSAVMAESLAEYVDVVKNRIATVKKTLESLQRPTYYKETVEAFAPAVMEDVPSDVAENWIDQLTIRQFNEELADVFPYIYKLVSEATKAQELTAEDLMSEKKSSPAGGPACWDGKKIGNPKTKMKGGKRVNNCVPEEAELESSFEEMMGQFGEGLGDTVLRKAKLKTTKGKPNMKDAPRWASALGQTSQGAWHWLEKDGPAETDDSDKYFPLSGKTEFTGFVSEGIETEGMDPAKQQEILKLFKDFDRDANEVRAYGDPDIKKAMQLVQAGKIEDAAAEIADAYSDQDGGEVSAIDGMYTDLVQELLYVTGADGSPQEGNKFSGEREKAIKNGEAVEAEEQKTPLGEFILSYFDRETGEFPKGETAVLTMVEKDYGDECIEPAKQFIMKVYEVTEQYRESETSPEFERMKELAGLR